MSAHDLCFLGIKRLADLLGTGEISPVELTRACLDRIEAHDARINSFINVFRDEALALARAAEQEIFKGAYRGPLHGIPFGLKDLFMVQGQPLTLGSRLFQENMAARDSTVALRLRQAGAILLGKQNMNPLAYGPFAAEPGYDFGHTFNPWDVSRITGGSSGGSAAAVAAGFCPFSVGSDTGGSVRIPATWCGIVAMKPTYGRISRHGVQALAWSLDHPGPLTRRVEDCALVLQALSGRDALDPSSAGKSVPSFADVLNRDIKGLRIGLPIEYWQLPADPEVKYWAEKAVKVLENLGAETVELSWPMLAYAENTSNIILLAEASSAYEQLVKERGREMWPALRLRLEAGLLVSAADYLRAQKARTLLMAETGRLFEKADLLVGPAMPVTASRPGQAVVQAGDRELGVVRAMTQYNEVFNLTGHPALSLPCGFSESGLPMGLQLVGRPFEEALVLQAAQAFEAATGFWKQGPEL
jgi:aspartyl-tRNA(Asn)/glutamyl-tRNA(Gln) amidotransferase subunit A